jgi:glutaredoxin
MTFMPYRRHYALLATAVIAMAWSMASDASAQTIYRSVGADGRVTFSDRAPHSPAGAVLPGAASPGAANGNELPAVLRPVQERFPVVLYSGNDCAPCDSARALLVARGIPFTERTINSAADIQALKTLSGQTSLPFASIGRQHLEGFAADEWHQYLTAAGYPLNSVLPAHYRTATPSPLTAVGQTATPAPAATRSRTPTMPPRAVSPTNPAGLSF